MTGMKKDTPSYYRLRALSLGYFYVYERYYDKYKHSIKKRVRKLAKMYMQSFGGRNYASVDRWRQFINKKKIEESQLLKR